MIATSTEAMTARISEANDRRLKKKDKGKKKEKKKRARQEGKRWLRIWNVIGCLLQVMLKVLGCRLT